MKSLLIYTVLGTGILFSQNGFSQHTTRASFEELQGIVAAYRCSGAIVDLGQGNDKPGTILTAGHCSADSERGHAPGRAVVDMSIYTDEEYSSYYIWHKPTNQMTMSSFRLRTIAYATMTKEDVTVFESILPLGEIKSKGLKTFKLAPALPKVGQTLQLTSGLWGQTQKCKVERIIKNNREEELLFGTNTGPIEMNNSILLSSECTAKGGWSGSPLFDPQTGLIYGVASRIYAPAPGSELAKKGTTARIIISSLVEFQKCLKNGMVELSNAGCQLPR